MKILIIVLILLGAAALLVLGIARYAYQVAFKAPARRDFRDYTLPPQEQYLPHHASIKRCMDALLAIPYEEVCITSFDGLKLFGRLYKSDSGQDNLSGQDYPSDQDNLSGQDNPSDQSSLPVHILFHGYKSNPYQDGCGGSSLAAELGHNFLVVDQRAHGPSEGDTITFGIYERKDCLAWAEYCAARFGPKTPVILWGLSMGAATVLMAADLDLPQNVKGIIADCPFSAPADIIKKVCRDMHFSPTLLYPFVKLGARLYGHFDLEEYTALDAVKHTGLPILLFHGEDDRFVPWEMSEALSKASPLITFVSIPKAGHGLCYMVESKRYHDSAITFIETVLH